MHFKKNEFSDILLQNYSDKCRGKTEGVVYIASEALSVDKLRK